MQSPKQEMINFRKNNKPDKKKNFVHFNQPQNILTENRLKNIVNVEEKLGTRLIDRQTINLT